MMRRIPALVLLALVLVPFARAQEIDPAALARAPWRPIGPAVMGGRIDDVAVDERTPSTIYVGSASGGVWKTVNAGVTWQPIFEHQGVSSIGDIAIAASTPDVVWVGTGEPNNRQSSTFGDGVYKSTDAGRTWTHMGLRDTQHIGRVLTDPANPDIVYVAALGPLWGPNTERGVFKTIDGGRTWTNTLFVNEDTGVVDLVMDSRDPQVLYAAAYQRRRVPWGFNGGGPGGGVYKTTDGGRTWSRLSGGLPQGIIGRIGLAISRKDPRVLYALVEHKDGGTFRSDDAGSTWRKVNALNPRPMYYSKIFVDPTDHDRVYVLGSSMFVSSDGGKTFADPTSGRTGANQGMSPTYDVGVHGDHHTLWIDPANPKHLVLGNDGGLYFSYDASVTWDKVNNIPIGQFYGISADMQKPYMIYGGLQDTHSWGGPSATRHHIGIVNDDWFQINFGDGMYAQVDPSDPDTIYTESQGGNITRFHRRTGDRRTIKPYPPPKEAPYRFNWTAPIVISPHDPKTIYLGGNRVFTSHDRGETWTSSTDVTRNENRDTLPIMGVLPSADMLSRQDGVSAWGTITTLAESPVKPGLLWTGSDDGALSMSRDGGANWTLLNDRLPALRSSAPLATSGTGRVSRVEPSRADANVAYVSVDRHEWNDFAPYLYVTRDAGQTWVSLTSNLPAVGWINVVREHPANPRVLFVGTETGLYVSVSGGESWTRFTGTFPTVPVDDLVIHPRDNDLIVATHGRSLFVLDDIGWLSGVTPATLTADVHLFAARAATVMQLWKDESFGAQRQFIGPNPPQGAILNYYLRSAAPGLKVVVRDAQDAIVRELAAPGDPGFNRMVWDLRASAPEGVPNARGPFVVPGRYRVSLSTGGDATTEVDVEWDPALPLSDEERRLRFTFLDEAGQLQKAVHDASTALTALAKELAGVQDKVRSAATVKGTVEQLQRRVGRGGGGEEEGFGGGLRSQVNGLISEIDGGGAQQGTLTGPTATQRARLEASRAEVRKLQEDTARVMRDDLNRLNTELEKARLPRIVITSPRTSSSRN